MNGDTFERSADMRLVELQRQSLGIRSPTTTWTRSQLELPHASEAPLAPNQTGIIVAATVDAQPKSGLIPGALVTVSIALSSEGDGTARGLRIAMPLPLEATFRKGTLSIDGGSEEDHAAESFFGEGLSLADLAPGERRTLIVQLLIEPGVGNLTIGPRVQIDAGAMLGPRGIRLTRGAAPRLSEPPERPFYEPDAEEQAVTALESALPVARVSILQPSEMPPIVPREEPPLERVSVPPARPAAMEAPVPEVSGQDVPEQLVVRGVGGPILTVALDRRRCAMLSSLFGGRSLGMIAHYLVLNALATTTALPEDGSSDELTAFVASQEHLLSRALIAARLGKPIATEAIAAPLPTFPPAIADRNDSAEITPGEAGAVRLMRAYRPTEIAFLARMLANDNAALFLRAAQCFVGLCASDIAIPDGADRRRIGTLLATYAGLAASEINRIFLRAKITRTPALFKETEPAFDEAARRILDALGSRFA